MNPITKYAHRRSSVAISCVVSLVMAAFVAHAQTSAPPVATTPSPAQAAPYEVQFEQWDTDKNNALSLAEFKAGLQAVQTAAALRDLREKFVAKDTNKDNVLDMMEYANLTLIKSAGAAAQPFSTFDTDKNQRMDFKEYVAMIGILVKAKP